ncbi:MAG: hypothetical protein LBD20_07190 [Spirochaetaceae bacterium]|jgi:hypothetical protein|nr:hypothetical protein [Spirochaetaceae bacterium]
MTFNIFKNDFFNINGFFAGKQGGTTFKYVFILLALCAALAAISCKTTQAAVVEQKPAAAAAAAVMPAEIKSLRDRVLQAQAEALNVRADKAVKDEYAAAVGFFDKGEAAAAGKNWKGANDMYVESEAGFKETAKIAAEKRNLAELAYREANQAIAEARRRALKSEVEGSSIESGPEAPAQDL